MPVPPPPPDPRHRLGMRLAVLLGPNDGSRPALTDRVDYLIPVNASVGVGGRRLDTIHFRYDLQRLGQRVQDIAVPSGFHRTVELRVEDPLTGDLTTLLAWGQLARPSLGIGSTESADFTARLDPHLFGDPLDGYPVHDPANPGFFNSMPVERDLVFNPEIDDKLYPNRSDRKDVNDAFVFVDPESLRTAPAKTLQVATATRWDLSTAVQRLCWTLNPNEVWIRNPSLVDLRAICGTQTTLLENLKIPLGKRLPEALDLLLEPHGFTWFLRHTIDDTDPNLPVVSTIMVIERGQGVSVDLLLQRIGETIDSAKTNADEVQLKWELAERPNVIRGFSKLALREGTFYLRPAWPRSLDSLTKADLEKAWKEGDHAKSDVFLKFVLDEAGDHTGTRDDFQAFTDLEELFDQATVPRRRHFAPALTRGKDRHPIGVNGYYLEWAEGYVFQHVTWGFSVLKGECGIVLERGVAEKLRSAFLKKSRSVPAGTAPDPMLRITCCIEGDTRTRYVAERRQESPNGENLVRDYDLSHKFKDAIVCGNGGPYESRLYTERHPAVDSMIAGTAGNATITVTGEFTWLKAGDRINVIGSTSTDGVFTIKTDPVPAGGVTDIDVLEPIEIASADGVVGLLTDEESPLRKLTAHVQAIQREEDFAPLHATAELFGCDHPEYLIGKIVPKVSTRNLQLDSLALSSTDQRHPQIVGLTYTLDAEQKISLHLEQYEGRLRYRV